MYLFLCTTSVIISAVLITMAMSTTGSITETVIIEVFLKLEVVFSVLRVDP